MMKICDREKCVGCGACANVCPQSCILMCENEEGFLYPKIDLGKCINCKKCVNHCPQNYSARLDRTEKPLVYAAYSKDKKQIKDSTSGGVFPVIASVILDMGGKVYGVQMKEEFAAQFICIHNKQEIVSLQGSKYVQSNTGAVFKEVKENLKKGYSVLFSGLPCQVAGLYSYLEEDYENLYTIDVICRGVPSAKVFREYISYTEKCEGAKLCEYRFRSKEKKWAPMSYGSMVYRKFENGNSYREKQYENPFFAVFLSNIAMNKSCYCCEFNGFPRVGDITLGDFAGLGVVKKTKLYNETGISQVLINSKKGKKIYGLITDDLEMEERGLDECCYFNLNLWKSSFNNGNRKSFFEDLEKESFQFVLHKYIFTRRKRIVQGIKNLIIEVLGEKMVLFLMHLKRKMNKSYPYSWNYNGYINRGNKNEKIDI